MSSTNQQKIKFAIVGYGHIGRRHAQMIAENPESELIAICDNQVKASEDIAWFSELQTLLSHPTLKPDVLSICTPNGLHAAQTIAGLKAGMHIICEKPMALSPSDCRLMIQESIQARKEIFCVMQNRFSPPVAWLKEIISANLLGDIHFVRIDCFWNRDERYYQSGSWRGTQTLDGGTLFTQFSHFLDLLHWIFGKPEQIKGRFANFTHQDLTEFEDSGTIDFSLPNKAIGSFNYSTAVWDKNLESSITVIGRNGSVQISGQYMNEIRHCHIKDYTMPKLELSSPSNNYGAFQGSAANHHFVIANVIDTLKGRSKPIVTPMEGLKVVELINEIYQLRDQQKTEC